MHQPRPPSDSDSSSASEDHRPISSSFKVVDTRPSGSSAGASSSLAHDHSASTTFQVQRPSDSTRETSVPQGASSSAAQGSELAPCPPVVVPGTGIAGNPSPVASVRPDVLGLRTPENVRTNLATFLDYPDRDDSLLDVRGLSDSVFEEGGERTAIYDRWKEEPIIVKKYCGD